MNCTITVSAPYYGVETLEGRRFNVAAEPRDVEITIRANSEEAMELFQRLQGMPGIPAIEGNARPDRALARLSANFQRRIDVD